MNISNLNLMAFSLSIRLWGKKAQDRFSAGPTIVDRFRVTVTTNGKQQTWTCATWPSFPFTCVKLFFYIKKVFHVIFFHENCIRLFLSAHFLFWEILNLSLPFAVNVAHWWLNLSTVAHNGYSVILFLSRKWKNHKTHLTALSLTFPYLLWVVGWGIEKPMGERRGWVTSHGI